jgi:predicted phosphoadenosine phosphosulfate sulfurtransferase
MPPWGIKSHPKFTFGMSFQDWMPTIFPKSLGTVGMLTGIRAQESIRRLRMALNKKKEKIMKELKSIDPNRVVFSPVDNLI